MSEKVKIVTVTLRIWIGFWRTWVKVPPNILLIFSLASAYCPLITSQLISTYIRTFLLLILTKYTWLFHYPLFSAYCAFPRFFLLFPAFSIK